MCLAGEGGGKGFLKKRRGVERAEDGLGLGAKLVLGNGLLKVGRGLVEGKGDTVNECFPALFAFSEALPWLL